jgi:hypothetical protein
MAFDVGLDGWEGVLDTYPTEIVLCPNKLKFRLAMATRPDWAKVYEDTTALVFLKRGPQFADLIDKSSKGQLVQPRTATQEYFP